jgi:polyferredoxin
MGAVFSLLPVLPLFSLQRDRDQCRKGCSACTMMCPSDIELPKNGSPAVMGDCFQCQKCIDTCPQGNVHIGLNKVFKGNEVIWTVVRAALLLSLLKWLGM